MQNRRHCIVHDSCYCYMIILIEKSHFFPLNGTCFWSHLFMFLVVVGKSLILGYSNDRRFVKLTSDMYQINEAERKCIQKSNVNEFKNKKE
jgi:hypothetical protein